MTPPDSLHSLADWARTREKNKPADVEYKAALLWIDGPLIRFLIALDDLEMRRIEELRKGNAADPLRAGHENIRTVDSTRKGERESAGRRNP